MSTILASLEPRSQPSQLIVLFDLLPTSIAAGDHVLPDRARGSHRECAPEGWPQRLPGAAAAAGWRVSTAGYCAAEVSHRPGSASENDSMYVKDRMLRVRQHTFTVTGDHERVCGFADNVVCTLVGMRDAISFSQAPEKFHTLGEAGTLHAWISLTDRLGATFSDLRLTSLES
jgi:hypothetical protein